MTVARSGGQEWGVTARKHIDAFVPRYDRGRGMRLSPGRRLGLVRASELPVLPSIIFQKRFLPTPRHLPRSLPSRNSSA